MSPDQLKTVLAKPGYGIVSTGGFGQARAKEVRSMVGADESPVIVPAAPRKRIRQSSRPLMNKLEGQFFAYLQRQYPETNIHPQAKRYRLGNGIWFKPDFTAVLEGREVAWETKGPKAFRGGFENLKVAASTYQEVEWWLAWLESAGEWELQRVLP